MHFRRGDLILAGAAALLAAVYALGVNSPHTAAQAVLSWGFVAAAAVYRTRPRASAVAVLVLLGLWAAVWLTAPVSLGVTPWLVFALLAVYGAERYVGSRVFGRAVLGVALAGALVSPVMWTLDTNLDWRGRSRAARRARPAARSARGRRRGRAARRPSRAPRRAPRSSGRAPASAPRAPRLRRAPRWPAP